MNRTAQIKNNLITRIQNSNDVNFLKALQTIFDSSEEALYQLSPEQSRSIEQGREDIKQGNFIENNQLMGELKTWLKNG